MSQIQCGFCQTGTNQESVNTYLSKISPSINEINERGKEIIIKCAFPVAAADGHIGKREVQLITKMARTKEMSSSHLKGVLHEMTMKETSLSNN